MKIKSILLAILFSTFFIQSKSQGTWTQLSDFGGGYREQLTWFKIGNYGYAGLGRLNGTIHTDIWQYDHVNDAWTQMASKPGAVIFSPGCFVIGDTAYLVSGWLSAGATLTMWAYIQSSNSWIQKNNFPGTARYGPVSFAINGKGYMGTGYSPIQNDFWEYDPLTDSWLQITNVPGPLRQAATGVAANGKGYAGLGYNSGTSFNDWYEFDPINNSWTQKAAFPGGARRGTPSFEMNNKVYVTMGYDDFSYFNDLWEYDPANNTWTQLLPNMPAAARYAGFGFGFDDCMFIGTGSNGGVFSPVEYQDVWRYCPAPAISFNSTEQNFCPGACTDFFSLTTNAISYLWSFPGGNPSVSTDANPISICYSLPGSYDVTLIISDSNSSDTLTIPNYISVFPFPSPQGILQNGDTLFANAGSASYQWYFNGNIINGATNYYYIAPEGGNYNVLTTDSNGCEVEAVIYDVVAGTLELNVKSNIDAIIYPNPFHRITTIRLTAKSSADNVSLEIFNTTGQRVSLLFNGKLNQGESKDVEFNGSELPQGIYFYRIVGFGGISSGRLTLIK